MFFPFLIVAQVTTAPAPSTTWELAIQTVVGLIIAAIGAYVIPYLRNKSKEANANIEAAEASTIKDNIQAKDIVVNRLKAFLLGTAAAIAEKRFPILAEKINSNQLRTSEQIKAELHEWGKELKSEAISYFSHQGIDLVAAVGDDYLDRLIERVANAVSPFPGRDTAVAILKDKASNLLIEKGVEYVRRKYLAEMPVVPVIPGSDK